MTITDDDYPVVSFQSDGDSYPIRQAFSVHRSAINDNQNQLTNIETVGSGAEIVAARDYADSVQERNRYASKAVGNVVIQGLTVAAQSTPDMTVQVSSGQAVVNGVLCYKSSSSNSNTITTPTTARYDVVVINSDNTLSVVIGNDSADRILPAIAITQRPLAILSLTSADTTITSSNIIPCKKQGCLAFDNEDTVRWFFRIQDAIDVIDNTLGGVVEVFPGLYPEEADFSDKNNFQLIGRGLPRILRPDDVRYCIKAVSTGGTVSNVTVRGFHLDGNSKAGTNEMLYFVDHSNLEIEVKLGDNSGSGGTYPGGVIVDCDILNFNSTFDDPINVATKSYVDFQNVSRYKINQIARSDSLAATDFINQIPEINGGLSISTTTYDAIFTALDPYLPNVGSYLKASGMIDVSGGGGMHITRVYKTASNNIIFYGYDAGVTAFSSVTITSGSGTAVSHLQLTW